MVPKVVGSSPIFHPKRPSSEGFFYNTQITTHLSFRVHPEKGNIPEFCQDIKPRNRDLQSPNKPHTFAITVFVEEIFDICISAFYIIIEDYKQANLAMKDDETHFML